MIGIWAPYPRTGRTTIAISLAYEISKKLAEDKKVLVCCTNGNKGTLLRTMDISSEEVGLEDLVSYKLAGFPDKGYNSLFARRGKIFFAGSSKMTPHFVKTHINVYQDIFDDLKNQFDIVIIDLPEGKEDLLGNMLIKKCDRIITVAEQDVIKLGELQLEIWPTEESFLIINKYKTIYPSKSDINNIFGLKSTIYHVPDCDMLREMKNKGKMSEYLTLQTDFNIQISNISMNLLKIDDTAALAGKPVNGHNRSLFAKFKMNMLGG